MADTEPVFVLVSCQYKEDPTNLKLVKYFCLNFFSKNTSFGFWSCSQLLQLKFIKTKLYKNAIYSAPKTIMGVAKVAKIFYLQLWGKPSMWIMIFVGGRGAGSKGKTKKREAYFRMQYFLSFSIFCKNWFF